MTNAAVAAPAAETQAANPAPETQATPTPGAGTDGQQAQPNTESTVQTAPSTETAPPASSEAPPAPPPPPPAPALSTEQLLELAEQRIKARDEQAKAEEAKKQTLQELRDLRRNGPKLARQTLDQMAEDLNIVIPSSYREALEDWAENLSLKSTDAAKLELGDAASEGGQALIDEQQAVVDEVYKHVDPARRAEFTAKVDGKGYDVWFPALLEYAKPGSIPGISTVTSLRTDAMAIAADPAINLPEAEQKALGEALASKTSAKDVLELLAQTVLKRGQLGPGAAPGADGARSAGGQPTSRADAELMHAGMHPSGQTITTAQMRNYLATGHI